MIVQLQILLIVEIYKIYNSISYAVFLWAYFSVSQSGWNRPLGGDFDEQGGNRGAKQRKGGENPNR